MRLRRAALVVALAAPAVVGGVVGLGFVGTRTEPLFAADDRPRIVDGRDQYALVREILDARSRPASDLVTAFDAVRAGWLGRRYLWEVALVPAALCRSTETCVVMPFDHLRQPELAIVQGWLPRIALSEEAHAALLRDCAAHVQCVFSFEGRLERFVLNPKDPTSIGFSDVEIASVRAAAPGESWIRRQRPTGVHSGEPNVVGN